MDPERVPLWQEVIVSKNLGWIFIVSFFVVALAASSIHCGEATPGTTSCEVAADCEGQAWGRDDCDRTEGHWECLSGTCTAVCDEDECRTVSDCVGDWTEDCSGHFACSSGRCEQVCENETCGNGECNAAGGETLESCPEDCDQGCEAPADCTDGHAWDVPCEGRWDCQANSCVEVCDYDSCGNGTCDTAQGENQDSCRGDCVEACLLPSDCYSEQWAPQICQGRWNCFQGTCQKICDDINCGNGIFWGLNGENEDSCFIDCLGGPCEEMIDCLGHRWYDPNHQACQGHWRCNPPSEADQLATGACEAVCDDGPSGGCGDGICDTANGETPTSCMADCATGYSCTKSEDCAVLTLPDGCTGTWICSSLLCVPQCE